MVAMECPWCESVMAIEPAQLAAELVCPDCLTCCEVVDEPVASFALAA
jgi:hypothetical protein